MAQAMGSTAKAMAATNKQIKVEDIQATMASFEKESMKMDMAGEMMDDTLDSLFDDDEEAEDAVMSQILDEIGIEVSDKVWTAGLCVCVISYEFKGRTTFCCIYVHMLGKRMLVLSPARKIRGKIRRVTLHTILGTCQNFTSSGRNLSIPIETHF